MCAPAALRTVSLCALLHAASALRSTGDAALAAHATSLAEESEAAAALAAEPVEVSVQGLHSKGGLFSGEALDGDYVCGPPRFLFPASKDNPLAADAEAQAPTRLLQLPNTKMWLLVSPEWYRPSGFEQPRARFEVWEEVGNLWMHQKARGDVAADDEGEEVDPTQDMPKTWESRRWTRTRWTRIRSLMNAKRQDVAVDVHDDPSGCGSSTQGGAMCYVPRNHGSPILSQVRCPWEKPSDKGSRLPENILLCLYFPLGPDC